LLGFSASFFLFAVGQDYLWLLYVSRILGGLFSGAVMVSAVAYVADVTSVENRTKSMGLVGMSIGLGFIFGPAFGGILSKWGMSLPFFVSSALAFATFLFVLLMLSESLTPEQRRRISGPRPSRWTAFTGSLKYLYVMTFLVSFSLAGIEATLQYYEMKKIGATPYDIGIMFLVSGIVGAIIQGGVIRRVVKPGMEARVITIGLLLSALGFFLLLLSSNLITAAIYLSVFGAGNALIRPCVTSLITLRATMGQGVATGLNSSMDSLGRITGPLIGGCLFIVQSSLPFVLSGALCLAALFMISGFMTNERQAKANTAA
jgi:MFS transporter, DHA1 family, multidrug resistance protein